LRALGPTRTGTVVFFGNLHAALTARIALPTQLSVDTKCCLAGFNT
jgi:hypothetical protein